MFIKSLKLKGILSFRDTKLKLERLNVLIGPNGAGKSNFIEVIGLLSTLSQRGNLTEPISRGGSIEEWLWAGEMAADGGALVEGIFKPPGSRAALKYELGFTAGDVGFDIDRERLDHKDSGSEAEGTFDRDQSPYSALITPDKTLLGAYRDNSNFALTAGPLAESLERTRIYRELGLGPSMASKSVQPPDQPDDFLQEDGSNLFTILNRMELDGSREKVEEHFKRFYEPFRRSSIQGRSKGDLKGNLLAIKERGLSEWTYANRLSDGTIRYLCLLAILCHPNPPPLICIEEPEIGLHPDILRDVALRLLEASERTQLIVTTHSDILIDALSADPETVVVCERDFDAGTTFRRLSAKKLKLWLEEFSLGELWRTGEIGGVRW